MGSRDLAVATTELTGKEDALLELASMMAEDNKDAAETLLLYRGKGRKAIANTPKCWIEPRAGSHRPSSFKLTEVSSPQLIIEAKRIVDTASAIIHIAYRT